MQESEIDVISLNVPHKRFAYLQTLAANIKVIAKLLDNGVKLSALGMQRLFEIRPLGCFLANCGFWQCLSLRSQGLRREKGEPGEKPAEFPWDGRVAPRLIPPRCVPVPGFHPFIEMIVSHEEPFPDGVSALGVRKEHPERSAPISTPVYCRATFQVNGPQFSAWSPQYHISAVAVGFWTMHPVASPN